jgi:outer membrane murein-binding lipoprotein Lpp
MAWSEDVQIARELATLTAAVSILQASVGEIRQDIRADREGAARSRQGLHNRLNEIGTKQDKLDGEITDLKDDVTQVKQVTDKVTRWQWTGIGVVIGFSTVSALLGAILAYFWNKIASAF